MGAARGQCDLSKARGLRWPAECPPLPHALPGSATPTSPPGRQGGAARCRFPGRGPVSRSSCEHCLVPLNWPVNQNVSLFPPAEQKRPGLACAGDTKPARAAPSRTPCP